MMILGWFGRMYGKLRNFVSTRDTFCTFIRILIWLSCRWIWRNIYIELLSYVNYSKVSFNITEIDTEKEIEADRRKLEIWRDQITNKFKEDHNQKSNFKKVCVRERKRTLQNRFEYFVAVICKYSMILLQYDKK